MLNGNPFKHRPVRLAWFERTDTEIHKATAHWRRDRQQDPGTRRRHKQACINHRRWPLNLRVLVAGFEGKVAKHDRDYPHKCLVDFPEPVDLGTLQGCHRYHVVPHAMMRRLPTPESELA